MQIIGGAGGIELGLGSVEIGTGGLQLALAYRARGGQALLALVFLGGLISAGLLGSEGLTRLLHLLRAGASHKLRLIGAGQGQLGGLRGQHIGQRLAIQTAKHGPGGHPHPLVHRQRGDAPAHPEAEINLAHIDIAVERQALPGLVIMVPQGPTSQHDQRQRAANQKFAFLGQAAHGQGPFSNRSQIASTLNNSVAPIAAT